MSDFQPPSGGPAKDLRFSPIHSDDHAGYLWIVTILCLIYTWLALVTRGHIKWGLYGPDDYLVALATVVSLGQGIAVFHGLSNGLAKFNSITNENEWKISSESFYISEILAILTLALAKCSIVALMLRLFTRDQRQYWFICAVMLTITSIWGVGSIIGVAADCNGSTILTTQNVDQCPNQVVRWQAITAIDIITEAAICFLPVALVWPLQMSLKLKFQVVAAFMFRIPVILFAALHLGYFKGFPHSLEPLFSSSDPLIWQQVMIAWSLLSATIPNLKAFMKSFSVGFGLTLGHDSLAYGSSNNNTFKMQSLKSSTADRDFPGGTRLHSKARDEPGFQLQSNTSRYGRGSPIDGGDVEGGMGRLRPDHSRHQTAIYHQDRSSQATQDQNSVTSTGSQELIIKREVQWNVYSEPHDTSPSQTRFY